MNTNDLTETEDLLLMIILTHGEKPETAWYGADLRDLMKPATRAAFWRGEKALQALQGANLIKRTDPQGVGKMTHAKATTLGRQAIAEAIEMMEAASDS